MECWNVGILGKRKKSTILSFWLPIIPLFHYSNIPWVLFGGPLLQPLIVGGAADPVPGLFVVEEWDPPAVALVILPHEFGIGLIMPDLELLNL